MNASSETKLALVKPALAQVIRRAAELSALQFVVTEGMRTRERQAELVKAGASWTMNSKHLTGDAVDLAVYVPVVDLDGDGRDDDGISGIRWDWPLYLQLAKTVAIAAQELGVAIRWGGTWQRLEVRDYVMADLHPRQADGPHFELAETVIA